jgi:hypothetical protein
LYPMSYGQQDIRWSCPLPLTLPALFISCACFYWAPTHKLFLLHSGSSSPLHLLTTHGSINYKKIMAGAHLHRGFLKVYLLTVSRHLNLNMPILLFVWYQQILKDLIMTLAGLAIIILETHWRQNLENNHPLVKLTHSTHPRVVLCKKELNSKKPAEG